MSRASLTWWAGLSLACAPAVSVPLRHLAGALGANPVEKVLNLTGWWALFFLILSLVPTPLKALLGWLWPMRLRRMLGVASFMYALCHALLYLVVDQELDLDEVIKDVTTRGFQAVGMLAFLLLTPLAVTSTAGWVRRLTYPRWKALHRLTYLASALAVVHFMLRVKADLMVPGAFALCWAVLMAVRLIPARR